MGGDVRYGLGAWERVRVRKDNKSDSIRDRSPCWTSAALSRILAHLLAVYGVLVGRIGRVELRYFLSIMRKRRAQWIAALRFGSTLRFRNRQWSEIQTLAVLISLSKDLQRSTL